MLVKNTTIVVVFLTNTSLYFKGRNDLTSVRNVFMEHTKCYCKRVGVVLYTEVSTLNLSVEMSNCKVKCVWYVVDCNGPSIRMLG